MINKCVISQEVIGVLMLVLALPFPQPVRGEVPTTQAAGQVIGDWGKPVERVQVRLRFQTASWEDGRPVPLQMDVRNGGTRTDLTFDDGGCRDLQIDGVWYWYGDHFGNPFYRPDHLIPLPRETQSDLPTAGRLALGRHKIRGSLLVVDSAGKTYRVLSGECIVTVIPSSIFTGGHPATQPAPASQDENTFDAVRVTAALAARVKAVVPQGWTGSTDENMVIVSRDKAVAWYNWISRNPSEPRLADGVTPQEPDGTTNQLLRIEVVAPMTAAYVAEMIRENDRVEQEYKQTHDVRKMKDLEIPRAHLYRIPALLSSQSSLYISRFLEGRILYHDKVDEAECTPVDVAVMKVLGGTRVEKHLR